MSTPERRDAPVSYDDRWSRPGWITYAAILLLTAGLINLLDGLLAASHEEYFVVPGDDVYLFDYSAWSPVLIIIGALQLLTSYGLFGGRSWARDLGVMLAIVATLGQVLFFSAQPLLSLIVIALNMLVVYALAIHWEED